MAIRGLYSELEREAQTLSQLNVAKSFGAISLTWLLIVFSIYFSTEVNSYVVYFVTVFFISTRQHALLILAHEGTHRRLFKSKKVNDWATEFFTAYPLLVQMRTYRKMHLQHHQFTNTEKDDSWIHRAPHKEWQFPMSPSDLWKHYKKFLFGHGIKDMLVFWRHFSGLSRKHLTKTNNYLKVLPQALFYLLTILVFYYYDSFDVLFLYWILPAITFLPILMRIRDIGEHFGLPHEHELNTTRNITCSITEKMIFAPFSVSLHLDHHLFPSVPFYNLPKLHKRLAKNETYKKLAHHNTSYFSFGDYPLLKDLIKSQCKNHVKAR